MAPAPRPAHAALPLLVAALALTPLAPATAATAPAATTSHYLTLTGAASDLDHARGAGCAQGTSGRSGLRVLFFGTQEAGGVLRHPGTTAATTTSRVPTSRAIDAAHAWARGFTDCRTAGATALLALGVNNKSDGGVGGATAGRAWATTVNQAARRATTDAVTITGAVDAEPSWSAPAWARDWVRAFTTSATVDLYAANSADGCPFYGSSSTTCHNGWTTGDVHYVAGGAAPARMHVIPQIYRTDGVQARQWSHISAWGKRAGAPALRFAGAMSQSKACAQRGCTGTDNTPAQAWTQLHTELNAHPETRVSALPHSTDMRWP
ncbi:hypothetical protein [Nocardiopsis ansamitocini]|uniref:Uncharacterized protein n=1 Tax=Nocardiopsis ansamitocini TaxID=1670832 RepID=A0A9W6P714_9ACTN|nr:hypothetical protein [Nocardiopsis ansamitocini]GLU48202.1 hypothetical protein Nans01_25530 [Nocardiopsis ansamitocini]